LPPLPLELPSLLLLLLLLPLTVVLINVSSGLWQHDVANNLSS
jgi:hypothetical protein